MEIKNLTNTQLLDHFKDAVADNHYTVLLQNLLINLDLVLMN